MAKALGSAPQPPVESDEEASSSSEVEENASGSESESESEPESKQTQPTKIPLSTPVVAAKIPNTHAADDTSSEEEESGSESDGPDSKPDPTIKPIVSKPVDNAPQKVTGVKRPRTKLNKESFSSPTKPNSTAGAKRPSTSTSEAGADGEVKGTKRSRKVLEKDFDDSEKKSKSFQRIWGEEDELALLKGMADFSANAKVDPVANIPAFHDFIRKFIHIDASRTQLQDKIRRLRKKYESNVEKQIQGKGKIFTSDHEQKAFELSKTAFGNETSIAGRKIGSSKLNGDVVIKGPSKIANAKKPVEVREEVDKHKAGKNSGGNTGSEKLTCVNLGAQKLGIEEWIMENNTQLVVGEERANMDEKWRKFRMEEAEMHVKKLELMLEEAKLVLAAMKSSEN